MVTATTTMAVCSPPFGLRYGTGIRNHSNQRIPGVLALSPLPSESRRRQQPSWRLLVTTSSGTGEDKKAEGQGEKKRAPPGVDTRIHWESDDEGWVGGSSSAAEQLKAETEPADFLGKKFADLLNESSNSHYQFLGVAADADLEDIKSAYRRLSKEYHPDTTSLPLKTASEKFMKLREIYDVLSNEESRRFYDWTLAQEAASRQAERMRMNLKDPYIQDVEDYQPVPDTVDRLGGKNLELSDQAMSALTFDLIAIVISICAIIYAIFFKEY